MKALVTKLMGSVNSSDIPYFNSVELPLRKEKIFGITTTFGIPVVLAADKGTLKTNSIEVPSQEIILNGVSHNITPSSEVTKVYIKTNLDTIAGFYNIDSVNGIYLYYMPNCKNIGANKLFASIKDLSENMQTLNITKNISGATYGDVSELKSNKYVMFNLYGFNDHVTGTLDNLCEHCVDGKVTGLSLENTKITGNINSVCNKVSLSSDCYVYIINSQIDGTVESVISYLTGKKTSSSLRINGVGTQITYNGKNFNKVKFTFDADGNPTLTEQS